MTQLLDDAEAALRAASLSFERESGVRQRIDAVLAKVDEARLSKPRIFLHMWRYYRDDPDVSKLRVPAAAFAYAYLGRFPRLQRRLFP